MPEKKMEPTFHASTGSRLFSIFIERIFPVSAIVFHVWTSVLAYTQYGMMAALPTLFLPFLSELFWLFIRWDDQGSYSILCMIHIVLATLWIWRDQRD